MRKYKTDIINFSRIIQSMTNTDHSQENGFLGTLPCDQQTITKRSQRRPTFVIYEGLLMCPLFVDWSLFYKIEMFSAQNSSPDQQIESDMLIFMGIRENLNPKVSVAYTCLA